ncbi:MAG: hypothetical protein ABRQ39_15695 [Candidatus Eremiobacterota bacterium]
MASGKCSVFLKESLIFLFFTLLSVLFFSPALLSGMSYIYRDIEFLFAPYQLLKRNMFLTGHINLWNPYIFSGVPYEANMGSGPTIFYPLSFIYYLFPVEQALVYNFIIHFTLAGYFMYLFGRYGLGGSVISSVTGGIAFSFSGFFITHLIHTFITGGAWLPLLFLCLKISVEKKSIPFIIITGIVSCILLLSGFMQLTYYIYCGLTLFWLWLLIDRLKDKSLSVRDRIFLFLVFPLICITAVLLSSIQLLPFLDFLKVTLRETGGAEIANTYCMTWQRLVTFIIPDFHGRPCMEPFKSGFYPEEAKKYWVYWETCGYTGITALAMSFVAIFYSKIRLKWFFLILFVLSLIASMTDNTPFYKIFITVMPFYKSLRSHGRFIILMTFSICSLSVTGMDELSRISARVRNVPAIIYVFAGLSIAAIIMAVIISSCPDAAKIPAEYGTVIPEKKDGIIIFACIISIITIAIVLKSFNMISRQVLHISLLLITIIDMGIFGFTFNPPADSKAFYSNKIKSQMPDYSPGDGRVVNLNWNDYVNRGQIEGFESTQGFDPLAIGYYMKYLYYSQYETLPDTEEIQYLINFSNSFVIKNYMNNKMIDLLNGKYINITDINSPHEPVIYQNVNAVPRAAVFYNYRVVEGDDEELLDLLSSKEFDSRKELILSCPVELQQVPEKSFEKASIIKYTEDIIEIEVNIERPALLFLSEIYYPGWKASVDGKPEQIYRADCIFRAVPLREPGKHHVKIYFDPISYKAGKIISITTILLILCYSGIKRYLQPSYSPCGKHYCNDQRQ